MSIKDIFLSKSEVEHFYHEALKGLISKNDLTETQKAQIIQYAYEQKQSCTNFIFGLMNANPNTSFEYWTERYFNYKQALQVIDWLKIETANPLPKQQTETKTDKLKVPQIALIHVYEGMQITRENAKEIAAKHGYMAKNSGEGLFQDYTYYCSTANRKGKPTPCTPKKLKNKIELFESVVNHLSDNNKQRAIDEINILKTIFENEYQ